MNDVFLVFMVLSCITHVGSGFEMEGYNKFGCSCFSLWRDYKVSSDGVAVLFNVKFGQGITVVPWYGDLEKFSDWQSLTGFYQVIYEENEKVTPIIREFTLGVVVSVGPVLSLSQRYRRLNELSEGAYLKLKKKAESTNDIEREKALRNIDRLKEYYGVPELISEQTREGQHKLVLLDFDGYPNKKMRKRFQFNKCKKLCREVVTQNELIREFETHMEFGLMKNIHEPPDEGVIISSEPMFAADAQLQSIWSTKPNFSNKILKQWGTRFQGWYGFIFEVLRSQISEIRGEFPTTLKLVESFESSAGTSTCWSYLMENYGFMKDFTDIDFPYERRSYLWRDINSLRQGVKRIVGSTPKGRLIPSVEPRILESKYLVDWRDEKASILRALLGKDLQKDSKKNLRQGFQNAYDFILNYRVSLPYQFTAYLHSSDGLRFHLLPLYKGNWSSSSNGDFVNFLSVHSSTKEIDNLNRKLKDLILMVWGSYIVKRYKKDSSERHSWYSNSKRIIRENHIGNQKVIKQVSPSEYEDADAIEFISINYVGVFHLACGHDIEGNSRNDLIFIVYPVDARIHRYDSTYVDYALKGSTAVVSFFKDGLRRLSHGIDPLFKNNLLVVNSVLGNLLYSSLFGVLKAERNMTLFKRNTCNLEHGYRRCSFSSNSQFIELFAENNSEMLWRVPEANEEFQLILDKCYSRVVPSACVERDVHDSSNNTFMECVRIPIIQSHALVERKRH